MGEVDDTKQIHRSVPLSTFHTTRNRQSKCNLSEHGAEPEYSGFATMLLYYLEEMFEKEGGADMAATNRVGDVWLVQYITVFEIRGGRGASNVRK